MADREDQVRRLARVFAYQAGKGVAFHDYEPLDDPRWLEEAETYIDYILTGGIIKHDFRGRA